ncbi:hypothetical protein JP35_10575 [Gallibacterium anatis]|uniref:Uncharacterized protein n=2 Tax=Gallibacterium anatis TaxID=750 RepID=A0A0A2XVU3_9PAST|nr:hypothetical protein [Gallibacterium anatis]KGQ36413.1 hypothetical protein JP35_10575 [Gallibacterium anatis]KGQ59294.1 hypothetical protein IE01_00090 [Gallibacterium anatis DSM 16844 = F 149]KGQ66094.1 hypothetical protein IO49_06285 [Gallibacterium anatis]OBW95121.1 hypothetical protein QV03_11745 [Gallibacterium anatis]STO37430.1 Uncharacterised protein [Gallibacterium anatis]
MSETFGYKLGKFIKNNFSSSTQKVVSAGVDSLEKRLNKPTNQSNKKTSLLATALACGVEANKEANKVIENIALGNYGTDDWTK